VGGWGAVLSCNGYVKEIYGGEKNTTNQRMELLSCIKALEALKIKGVPVEIYSDSAYLVNCMQQGWHVKWRQKGWITSKKEPVANRDLWEKLLQLISGLDIQFHKVKGHSGNELNEKADWLAQKGVDDMLYGNFRG